MAVNQITHALIIVDMPYFNLHTSFLCTPRLPGLTEKFNHTDRFCWFYSVMTHHTFRFWMTSGFIVHALQKGNHIYVFHIQQLLSTYISV